MKKLFNKLFGRLEKPYALPMEGLCDPDEYTWEDWARDSQSAHPFRYWLWETLPMWFRVHITMNIENFWYWVRTHTYNRYHMLDLRSNVGINYRWGWIESDIAMMLACFNLLRKFVEIEDGLSILSWKFEDEEWWKLASKEEQQVYFKQRNDFTEIKKLYDWWMIDRQKEQDRIYELYNDNYDELNAFNDGRIMKRYEAYEELDKIDDVMLEKLIRYRRYLWT
jgi:hypothetical protein